MEHCPNCQAEIREGARFCTKCGYRLPDPPLAEPAAVADPWPAPPDQRTADGWPLPEDVPVNAGGDPLAGDSQATAEPADGPIWAETPVGGDVPASPEVVAWPSPIQEPDRAPDSAGWVAPEIGSAPATDAPWRPDAHSDVPVEIGAAPDDIDVAPEPAEGVPEGGADDAPVLVEASLVAIPETVGNEDAESELESPVARAGLLIEELRLLLPRLAGGSGDQAAIAERLERAASEESGRWPDLRAAMEDARANPRDVEIVLGLSRRVDDVIALIDANDRLAAAARDAAAALRGEPASDS